MKRPIVIDRFSCNTHDLVQEYPPEIYDENKLTVYRIACPKDAIHRGEINYSRWETLPLPDESSISTCRTGVDIRSDVFGYGVPINDGVAEWYLNFAHFDLFCAYGGSLLAQDELQVAEHPALGSLREALLIRGVNFETVEDNKPTPVLIRNVERRCSIDTEATPQRPFGLYGNAFARASFSDISAAAIPLKPTTFTNIIAMEAPTEGYGDYTAGEIGFILSTAYTGFSAALHESHTFLGAKEVVIHTGFWGCGAYGGNRVLMVALQIIAANLSSLDRLVFHTVDSCGAEDVNRALDFLKNEVRYSPIMPMADLIDQIVAYGFEWGESDGN